MKKNLVYLMRQYILTEVLARHPSKSNAAILVEERRPSSWTLQLEDNYFLKSVRPYNRKKIYDTNINKPVHGR
jgi:hypothetical protein